MHTYTDAPIYISICRYDHVRTAPFRMKNNNVHLLFDLIYPEKIMLAYFLLGIHELNF